MENGATVISFVNQSGGCGKSTLTVHLAAWLAEQGINVAVVDIDDQAACKEWLKLAAPKVTCLSVYDPAQVVEKVQTLRPHVQAIVCDCPPRLKEDAIAGIKVADYVLVPMKPSAPHVRGTLQTMTLAKRLDRVGRATVVFNMADVPPSAHNRWAMGTVAAMGARTANATIADRTVFEEAARQGTVAWRMPNINKGFTQAARLAITEFESLLSEVLPHELRNKGSVGVRLQRYDTAAGRGKGAGGGDGDAQAQQEAA